MNETIKCNRCKNIVSKGILHEWSNRTFSVCCNCCWNQTKNHNTKQEALDDWVVVNS